MKPWNPILTVRSFAGNQEHMATLPLPKMLDAYINIRHVRGMALANAALAALSIVSKALTSDSADIWFPKTQSSIILK